MGRPGFVNDSRATELLKQLQQRPAKTSVSATSASPSLEKLAHTSFVKVGDRQVLVRHPARQTADDPQLLSNRRGPVTEVGQSRAERIEVNTDDAGT